MLNEDKIKLMTGIAMFEKREGKNLSLANRYFEKDYISSRMMRSFLCYTICYLLCAVIWVLYRLEELLQIVELQEITDIGVHAGVWYLAGLVLYLMITHYVARKRYDYARRGVRVYVAKLKRLEKRYTSSGRMKES